MSLILTLLAALFAGGCWDYLDIENRAPVMTLAIDLEPTVTETQYLTSVEIPVAAGLVAAEAGGAGPQPEPRVILTQSDATLAQAIGALNLVISRRTDLHHIVAIVVSEELAREGLAPVVDFILRFPRANPRAILFVLEGQAADILRLKHQFQPLTALFLTDLADQFPVAPYIPMAYDLHTFNHRFEEGATMVPRLAIQDGNVRMNGAGVISGGRLIGTVEREIMVGTNWLAGDLKRAPLTLRCPTNPDETISLELRVPKRRVDVEIDDGGRPVFQFHLQATAGITDLSRCHLIPLRPEARKLLEDAAAKEVERLATEAFEHARLLQTDYLRLWSFVKRKYYPIWRDLNWRELFMHSRAVIDVTIEINNTGRLDRAIPFD